MLRKRWIQTGTWAKIEHHKQIYEEQRNNRDFEYEMSMYADTVAMGKGALFIAVHRGKLSEGIDFSDSLARAVLVAGIPYPSGLSFLIFQSRI